MNNSDHISASFKNNLGRFTLGTAPDFQVLGLGSAGQGRRFPRLSAS